MSFTYRNKSDQELVIPGVGSVKPNETITSERVLENPNLANETTPAAPASTGQVPTPPAAPAKPEEPKGEIK